MLSRCALTLAGALLLVSVDTAAQDDAKQGLRRPERITVGMNDQFLGQLSPDEHTLYFASSQETRKEIYAQDDDEGRARLVFDEGADVSWPRVSPDGKALLYVSFGNRAAGQLCVRRLPEGDQRRCLDDAPAVLQAEWIDNQRIVMVSRASIDGDLQLSQVAVTRQLSARPLRNENWTNPTVSPDARWLVYVPLDRMAKHVGPGFAARASHGLEVVRLSQCERPTQDCQRVVQSASIPLAIDLPGLTAQPAFSRDGRFLYFVQFFSDSNHDGIIDASDHGVLFRLPWSVDGDDPAHAVEEAPLQLTDSRWNCQYPAPATTRLIATCTRGRGLDLYELPLDGEVPSDWTLDRVRMEIGLGARREELLMLYRHALARADSLSWRRLLYMRLLITHLEMEEFAAAEFYAHKVKALRDKTTRGISQPLLTLVEHRRARSEQERGRLLDSPIEDGRARMESLADGPKDSPAARILNHVVRSEIADTLGDKRLARAELDLAIIDDETPRPMIEVYFARADALFRGLDDRAALIRVSSQLAASGGLKPDQQLDYARAATRALVRGLPFDEAVAVLKREHEAQPSDSELSFALELAQRVLAIREERPGREVKAGLIAFYDVQTRADRKRAIILDAVQRAAELGADSLIEGLSERYIEDVAPGTQERRRTERLYRSAILGRAFRRLERGRLLEACADFDAVFQHTGALEAVVGAIELRLREGKNAAAIQEELALLGNKEPGIAAFVKAYLIARTLPALAREPHAQAVEAARTLLRGAWSTLKNEGPARALYGFLMHEQFVRTGALDAAERANSHYLVALELVQRDHRYRATVLAQLGLLHSQVGNHRIALGYLEQRGQLPYADELEELTVRLATARALLHVGKERESALMSEQALALLEHTPTLAPYRALALDRAALGNLAAGQLKRALALYDQELPLLAASTGGAALRNRFVVRLARIAAAIGAGQPARACADLEQLESALDKAELGAAFASAHVSEKQAKLTYRLIAAGLRANASLALGKLDDAHAALETRRALFAERHATTAREEDTRALMLVESRLAENAVARRDFAAATKWTKQALSHADALSARGDRSLDPDALYVLWLAADMQLRSGMFVSPDLSSRLRAALSRITSDRVPALRHYQRWFEVYLAQMASTAAPNKLAPVASHARAD